MQDFGHKLAKTITQHHLTYKHFHSQNPVMNREPFKIKWRQMKNQMEDMCSDRKVNPALWFLEMKFHHPTKSPIWSNSNGFYHFNNPKSSAKLQTIPENQSKQRDSNAAKERMKLARISNHGLFAIIVFIQKMQFSHLKQNLKPNNRLIKYSSHSST